MKRENLILLSLLILFLLSAVLGLRPETNASAVPAMSSNLDLKFSKKPGIAVMYLYGPIMVESSRGWFPDQGLDGLISQLYSIEKDPRIKALVLRVNSPGGSVGASQELYQELIKFKERTQLPIIVSVADVNASGAYWASAASDYIFANAGSMIGSIGVIMSSMDLTQLKEKYGVGMKVFKSGAHKDLLSSWRETTDEERDILNSVIQDVYEQFVDVVATARNKPVEYVKKYADGRIFTGNQAKELGFIDEVGGFRDALEYTWATLGYEGEPRVILRTHRNIMDFFNRIGTDSKLQFLKWMM